MKPLRWIYIEQEFRFAVVELCFVVNRPAWFKLIEVVVLIMAWLCLNTDLHNILITVETAPSRSPFFSFLFYCVTVYESLFLGCFR